jgi:molybdopterin-guanine dinucleotide biosynthesis protein MobB
MKSSGEKRTMVPIISIVGRSKSGKTTLIERLIPEFMKRGYRVATIKHLAKDFQIDHEDKDSWRHKQAGAQTAVISSPQKVALVEDVSQDLSLDELATRFIQGADIIIAEGFKRDIHPKIEVFRKGVDAEPLAPQLQNVIAVVSDCPLSLNIPYMDSNDIKGIADVIEERIIRLQHMSDSTSAGQGLDQRHGKK